MKFFNKHTAYIFSFFVAFFIFFVIPSKAYAFCGTASLTPSSPPARTQNTTYTIVLNGCDFGGIGGAGLYVDVVVKPHGTTTEIYRKLVMGATEAQPHTTMISNFVNQSIVDQFGQDPGQGQFYDVYLELKGIGGILFDTQQTNPPTMQILYTGQQPQCDDIIPNGSGLTCPTQCPAVDKGNGTSQCTVPPTQAAPAQCSMTEFTVHRLSDTRWLMDWKVNSVGLRAAAANGDQFRTAVIRNNIDILNARYVDCGGILQSNIDLGLAAGQCDGPFQGGDNITFVVEKTCNNGVGKCGPPYLCETAAQQLLLTQPIETTITPGATIVVTPVPTPYCSDVLLEQCLYGCTPTIGGGTCKPAPGNTGTISPPQSKPGPIQTCMIGGGAGIETGIGCIPSNPAALFKTLLTIAIGIAGGIAFLLIILGGMRILTSSGNPESMNEGREIVTSAITGLLLIIFSIFLLRLIGVDILAIPGFS